jgi:hypothetical protein
MSEIEVEFAVFPREEFATTRIRDEATSEV